jgi:hypothetical protein
MEMTLPASKPTSQAISEASLVVLAEDDKQVNVGFFGRVAARLRAKHNDFDGLSQFLRQANTNFLRKFEGAYSGL